MSSLWFLALLVLAVLVWAWRRLGTPPQPESSFLVEFNDDEIWVSAPDGGRQSVAWNELTRVSVKTTAEGPFKPDVFWALHNREGHPTVAFPGGATGETDLLGALQDRLSDFQNEVLIEAMGSTSEALFVVWEKSD